MAKYPQYRGRLFRGKEGPKPELPKPVEYIDIVFDGPPGPDSGRFVEVESPQGQSITFGHWVLRSDGLWALRFRKPDRDWRY